MVKSKLITRHIALAAIVAIAVAAGGCGEQTASPTATPPPDPLSPPTAETAGTTPVSPTHLDATPLVEVTGLFSDPRPTHVDEQRSLGPKPALFAGWNRTSTMLYDVETGSETDLGPGGIGRFTPDGTKMVWAAAPSAPYGQGTLMMLDLATGVREIATAPVAAAVDKGGNAATDNGTITPDGYELRREYQSDSPFPTSRFTLTNRSTGVTLLVFDAYIAVTAGKGALAVAAIPEITGVSDRSRYPEGTINIFLVDIESGTATFVGTSVWAAPSWSLAADERYVVWTVGYCDLPHGRSRIYDRRAGKITEIDEALWPAFTPGGLILDGPFGGNALIDPATFAYRAAIPAFDTSWSPDFRYVSIGQVGGHGGLCP